MESDEDEFIPMAVKRDSPDTPEADVEDNSEVRLEEEWAGTGDDDSHWEPVEKVSVGGKEAMDAGDAGDGADESSDGSDSDGSLEAPKPAYRVPPRASPEI